MSGIYSRRVYVKILIPFEGKVETINGVEAYVSLPEGEYPKDKAVCEYSSTACVLRLNDISVPGRCIRNTADQQQAPY